MNKKYIKPAIIIAVVVVIIGIFSSFDKEEVQEEETTKKQIAAQTIETQNEVVSSLTASGTIVPKQYSAIRSLVQGTLEYISPVGTDVTIGTSLFRIRDDSIESGHFNALQNLQQTNVLTGERIAQAELSLNSAEARFELTKKNLETTELQTTQTLKNTKDSAIIAYNSAYNTINQLFNFISIGSISNLDYKYKNISTTDTELKESANLQYDSAVKSFLKLSATISAENIDEDLTQIDQILNQVKLIVDSTTVLLQSALGGVDDLVSDKSVMTSYQTQINGHASAIITNQNALRNTVINNDLIINQAKNQLELSKIELNNAQISLENAKNSAQLELTISQSQLDNASYSFNNLSLGSPFSGTVMSNSIEPGQQVSVGQQILELGNLSIVEIEVEIDTEFAKGLKRGDTVMINDLYEGIISEIEPTGSIESGKVGVTVQSPNEDGFLEAGDIADITFNLVFTQEELIIIPIKSATIESTNTYVFVIENGRATRRSITLGKIFGNKVSVTSGLDAGDILILKNGVFISEGDEVEVTK